MDTFLDANIARYQVRVVKTALKFYLKTGGKVNRAYTITNMLRFASKVTGNTYKRGQGAVALADLESLIAADV